MNREEYHSLSLSEKDHQLLLFGDNRTIREYASPFLDDLQDGNYL